MMGTESFYTFESRLHGNKFIYRNQMSDLTNYWRSFWWWWRECKFIIMKVNECHFVQKKFSLLVRWCHENLSAQPTLHIFMFKYKRNQFLLLVLPVKWKLTAKQKQKKQRHLCHANSPKCVFFFFVYFSVSIWNWRLPFMIITFEIKRTVNCCCSLLI